MAAKGDTTDRIGSSPRNCPRSLVPQSLSLDPMCDGGRDHPHSRVLCSSDAGCSEVSANFVTQDVPSGTRSTGAEPRTCDCVAEETLVKTALVEEGGAAYPASKVGSHAFRLFIGDDFACCSILKKLLTSMLCHVSQTIGSEDR
jgi:hypothetical protein